MEETLNVYHRPPDPARPLVCFDEASKQLVDHVTAPIEASLEHPTQIIDYAAFPPEEARRLINKLEIHYTPKHGSWLNMAEIELGILGRQCLDRRIPHREQLKHEVAAWQRRRNDSKGKVDWQFTTADARLKLKRLYPVTENNVTAP